MYRGAGESIHHLGMEGHRARSNAVHGSETDFAGYLGRVLESMLSVGSNGAMLWCFADYAEDLWSSPPCDEAIHERFFGLVRPDGSLKPHADVVRRFARTQPTVQPAAQPVARDVTEAEFYLSPRLHAERLHQTWRCHSPT